MIIVWTTGLYPANSFEWYGIAEAENWLGTSPAPPASGTLRMLPLLGVGL